MKKNFLNKFKSMLSELGDDTSLRSKGIFLPLLADKEVSVSKIDSPYLEEISVLVGKTLNIARSIESSSATELGSFMQRKKEIYKDLASLYEEVIFFFVNKGKNVYIVKNGRVYSMKDEKSFNASFETKRSDILMRIKSFNEDFQKYKSGSY